MVIDRHTKLFFEASVLVAGAHSPQGGSTLLLEACTLDAFTAQVTFLVVLEAYHALERDFPRQSIVRFHRYVAGIDWALLPVPSHEQMQTYASLIHPKDLHVLAAAAEGGSEFLLTLDRKHTLAAQETVEEADLSIRILTPGDFIRQYYLLHEAYPSLPPRRT